MIFKIQRPIVTNDPLAKCLIYNKERTIEFHTVIEDIDLIFGKEFKIYAEGEILGDDFHIYDQVEDQDW